jgi:hypothetical protein
MNKKAIFISAVAISVPILAWAVLPTGRPAQAEHLRISDKNEIVLTCEHKEALQSCRNGQWIVSIDGKAFTGGYPTVHGITFNLDYQKQYANDALVHASGKMPAFHFMNKAEYEMEWVFGEAKATIAQAADGNAYLAIAI